VGGVHEDIKSLIKGVFYTVVPKAQQQSDAVVAN
jgi:hypothetical protein